MSYHIIPDTAFQNILFIGDPHATSLQISARHDDEHTMVTVLDKLSQAAKLSHEHKAYTVILGDLIDRDNESSIVLHNRLINVLKSFYHKPITIIGNHEKTESVINEKNMITALINAGIIDCFEDNQSTVLLKVEGEQIEIGGTNYGSKIPAKVEKQKENTNKVIWITHHDLMFKDYYPGALPIREIKNVDLAINGHMHKTQPQIQMKTTTWCCPGNILRQTRDTDTHVPSVWLWNPDNHNNEFQKLIQIPLKYKKDIFKKPETIEPTVKQDFQFDFSNNNKLKFIELSLEEKNNQDNNKTSDQDLVKGYMENLISIHDVPKEIADELFELLKDASNIS